MNRWIPTKSCWWVQFKIVIGQVVAPSTVPKWLCTKHDKSSSWTGRPEAPPIGWIRLGFLSGQEISHLLFPWYASFKGSHSLCPYLLVLCSCKPSARLCTPSPLAPATPRKTLDLATDPWHFGLSKSQNMKRNHHLCGFVRRSPSLRRLRQRLAIWAATCYGCTMDSINFYMDGVNKFLWQTWLYKRIFSGSYRNSRIWPRCKLLVSHVLLLWLWREKYWPHKSTWPLGNPPKSPSTGKSSTHPYVWHMFQQVFRI